MNSLIAASRRLRLRLEFEGSGFCGWQLQSEEHENQKTSIQGNLERALKIVLRSSERVVVHGCGRTDAGVGAREFYVHFDLPVEVDSLEKMRHSLNGLLDDGVCVTHCDRVPETFHVLRDVEWKIYEYTLFVRRAKPTLNLKNSFWIPEEIENLDVASLEKALQSFEGEHDVSSFAASDHGLDDTVRKIFWTRFEKVLLDPRGEDPSMGVLLKLRFCGEGFLRHQVRTMAGTLVEVAQRKREWESVRELLLNPAPRSEAGFCAPAEGLILCQVSYEVHS